VTGDIELAAGLTVFEEDDGVGQFARWIPFAQNGLSRSANVVSAREDDGKWESF